MELLFKQKLFSWLDSYDIFDEAGNTLFTVKGRLAWGHCLEIFGSDGGHLGTVKEEIFTFLPRFALYIGDDYIGEIQKKLTFFKPLFQLDCNDWEVQGDLWEWEYSVLDSTGRQIMQASKELFNWTDTYRITVGREEDALLSLMIVLAIDAAKCGDNNG